MTEQQKARAERLREHPDTIEIDLHDEKRPWLLGKYAIDLAKARGVKVEEVLGQVESENVEAGFEQMCRLLWTGFLPFEPELEVEDFSWLLSFADVHRLMPQLTGQFGEFLEEVGEGNARAAQGAADRKKGRS